MAEWQVVAEGTSIGDLESTVGELELPKGSRVLMVMDLKAPLGFLFDVAGAELLAKGLVPDGMVLIDVWGEGSQGFIEMEADPVWLLAVLAFIKAHRLAILIAIGLGALFVASVIILVKIAVAPALPIAALAIGGGLALIGIILLARRREGYITPVTEKERR